MLQDRGGQGANYTGGGGGGCVRGLLDHGHFTVCKYIHTLIINGTTVQIHMHFQNKLSTHHYTQLLGIKLASAPHSIHTH